jgi:hypothetical protein
MNGTTINHGDLSAKVIEAFGGLTKLSRALQSVGVRAPVSTVQHWSKTAIPAWRRRSIIDAAKQANIQLPEQFLTIWEDAA